VQRGATGADRQPERGVRRLFLRTPAFIYFGPIASALRWRCVLLLTTTGRTSGRPRRVTVSFLPLDGSYVIFAGWGQRANWLRNVAAQPRVTVRVGHERFSAYARPVEDQQERAAFMRRMAARSQQCGPPRPLRGLLSAIRLFDYEAEIRRAVALEGDVPVVVLEPVPS
jgi:deazaflavin-dependent oxidoreductase (nitroreductase family)